MMREHFSDLAMGDTHPTCPALGFDAVGNVVLASSLSSASRSDDEEEDDYFGYGNSPSCSKNGNSTCSSPCRHDGGFVRSPFSSDNGSFIPCSEGNCYSFPQKDGGSSYDYCPGNDRVKVHLGASDGYACGPGNSSSDGSNDGYEPSSHGCSTSFSCPACVDCLNRTVECGNCTKQNSSPVCYGCGISTHTYGNDQNASSSCHNAGPSSMNHYGDESHRSENESCNFEDDHVISSSQYCPQNHYISFTDVSAHNKGDLPFNLNGVNDGSNIGCGCGNLSHDKNGNGSLPHCSANSDQALSDSLHTFAPGIHGTTMRGKLRVQEAGNSCVAVDGKKNEHKQEREHGRSFQLAVDSHDWDLAESLIPLADKQRQNDWLCIAIDSVWFLCTHEELSGATRLMEKLVKAGADDFTRAALRTTFLASCVSACQSRTMSRAETATVLAERLHERLQECSGYEILKAEAVAKVRKFAEWALKCIGLHSQVRRRGHDGQECPSTPLSAQLQLRAFKRFLDLAGNRLTGKDYTEAFDAACFPLTLFSIAIDSGWASGIAASAMQGLLGMLVEGGADNVNQCCLEAARFGSTELLQMLLQIAQRNGIEVDVDLALGFASHYCKLGTMECLVDVGNATAFLGPLMRAADRGCMPVVEWFVEKGCRDMELCLALTAAASSSKVDIAEYLMKRIPLHVLRALSLDILKAAAERSGGCLVGIAFLFQHDFLGSPKATYAVADSISKLEDESVPAGLKAFCKDEWSYEAFLRGRKAGEDHYLNVLRALHYGSSPLQLQALPLQLQVAIAYLPLYKECAASCGLLLSQWLRGQLVEAALRLDKSKCCPVEKLMEFDKGELLTVLKSVLPSFFVKDS